ncbi:plakophilin-1 [Osmerus eperlanus]|uniref:plakophilin-1 n=1 Tax=Osmerus eperlanus TaxID=29151 RepID=UPI002E134CAD
MTLEPLRSARSIGNVEDTSLALPSDSKLRSGQQRVLDQVHTIKRSKSKQGKNGSLSPASPQSLSMFAEFGSFKFSPSKANGTFSRSNSSGKGASNKAVNVQKSRSLSVGRKHFTSSSQWEQQMHSKIWPQSPNGLKPSRSDPALGLAPVPAPVPQQRAKGLNATLQNRNISITSGNSFLVSSQSRIIQPPSVLSHHETKTSLTEVTRATKTEQQSEVDATVSMADMTLKEAVEFLASPEENYQQCGASFIQHTTFKEDRSKQEVLKLGGIPPLVALLSSSHPAVSQSASAALRNLVFRDQANKLEVQACGGIDHALQLLKETDSTETQKQLTGLLWNLSSADELKGELIDRALPVLTESVVVPFTCWSESSVNHNIHPDVFYSATGCLRNLSCARMEERQAMRVCPGLINSLMSYVQSCIAEDNPDDKSVENCACILHNLTFQLEKEVPQCFSKFISSTEQPSGGQKSPTIGCFSPKSSKINREDSFSYPVPAEESEPEGVSWLCHSKAMKMYLSLLGSAQKEATLEACCGALQNLTANKGLVSSVMSQTLVQKLGALGYVSPLIQSPNPSLQKSAMSLVGNISRTASLQSTMAKQLLPDLVTLLSSGSKNMGNNDDLMATTSHTARSLLLADPEIGKKVVTTDLVTSLCDLSENGSFPKASKAASLLLYSLWNEKTMQGLLKKLGMNKSVFVNDTTTAVHKSVQVVD